MVHHFEHMKPLTTTFDTRLADLVVFDLETTGFFPGQDEIYEIGAVRVSPDLSVERGTFERRARLVHPERVDRAYLSKVGVVLDELQQASPLSEVLKDFADFSDGSVVAGYNVAFDWGFMKAACQTHSIDLNVDYHIFDVMSLILSDVLRSGRPTSLRLRDALLRFGLPPQPEPHRALTDARLTLAVLRAWIERAAG